MHKFLGRAKFINPLGQNHADFEEVTPLHTAAKMGSFDIYKLIVKNGKHANLCNNSGQTPLHSELHVGKEAWRAEVVNVAQEVSDEIWVERIRLRTQSPVDLEQLAGQSDLTAQVVEATVQAVAAATRTAVDAAWATRSLLRCAGSNSPSRTLARPRRR